MMGDSCHSVGHNVLTEQIFVLHNPLYCCIYSEISYCCFLFFTEKMGKVAPSVFSRARSGAETAFNTRSGQPIRK